MIKLRFAQPAHLIDLGRIGELRCIRREGNEIRIGAMTTENELIWSTLLQEQCPLLVDTARHISDPQARYRGTIGGDIAHGDPGNDHPAVMLCLGASFVLRGPAGERVVPADVFFQGMYTTAAEVHEILTEIRIPAPAAGTGSCYAKLKRTTGDFATAAAAVLLRVNGVIVEDVSIALTNVAPAAFRAISAEQQLRGSSLEHAVVEDAARRVMAQCEPTEDLRGSVEHNCAMVGEMTRPALRAGASRVR